MSVEEAPQPADLQDDALQQAIEEEQALLTASVREAQVQFLLNRCVELSAELKRERAKTSKRAPRRT